MRVSGESFPNIPQAALLLLAFWLLELLVHTAFFDFSRSIGLGEHELVAMAMLASYALLLTTVLHITGVSHARIFHDSASTVWATALLLLPPIVLLVPLVVLMDLVLISTVEWLLPVSQWEEQVFSRMMADSVGAFVAVCLLAPILEEMLFRGVLLRSFLNQYDRWRAIGASAFLFGVAHLNVYQFLLAASLGLLLGWLYERSRSLVPCIALHGLLNTWVFLSQRTGADKLFGFPGITLEWVLVALVAGALGGWLLYRILVGRSVGCSPR